MSPKGTHYQRLESLLAPPIYQAKTIIANGCCKLVIKTFLDEEKKMRAHQRGLRTEPADSSLYAQKRRLRTDIYCNTERAKDAQRIGQSCKARQDLQQVLECISWDLFVVPTVRSVKR